MSHDFDHYDDPAAATVFLAAEAAVLTERVRLLRRQLADVDARIRETAEKMRRLDSPHTAMRRRAREVRRPGRRGRPQAPSRPALPGAAGACCSLPALTARRSEGSAAARTGQWHH